MEQHTSSNTRFLFFLFILLILFSLLAFFIQKQKEIFTKQINIQSILLTGEKNKQEQEMSEASTIDTSDWLTYRNEEYGFSFRYPSGWEVREGEKCMCIGFFSKGSKPHEESSSNFNIFDSISDFWDYDGEKTLEEYIWKRSSDYNQELFRFRDVKETKIAGQKAIQYIDYNGYQGDDMLNFYWQYKGKIFSMSFFSNSKKEQEILKSFYYF